MAGPSGLVIVLEDLHWADSDTLAVVEYLGRQPVGSAGPLPGDQPGTRIRHTAPESDQAAHSPVAERFTVPSPGWTPDSSHRWSAHAYPVQTTRRSRGSSTRPTAYPFLVEEVLASPGVPASFSETVRARLNDFPEEERVVLSTAAIFGRQFDWRLVSEAVDRASIEVVTAALERGVQHQLLVVENGAFSFRHALTREAVLERLLPPRRQALAAAAL